MEISKAELASAAAATSPLSQDGPQELMGAEILVKALQAENVKHIWGYPGGAVLYIYDAFYKQDTIQHVLVRHEQAAVHAADGYARATGDVGVALVTSGPGVTNAVTGIATAYMDSIPMVIITGQVPTPAIGLDAFQECDTVGITRPIVKHNFLVKDVRDLAMTVKKAFHIARTGRPGPVVVDIPKDVSFKKTTYAGYPKSVEMRSYNPVRKGHGGQIRKALQLLLTAKRPYIYTGGGVLLSNASAELRTLVEMLGYPVTNTLMGLGAFPASDRKFLGMLGMHGTLEANNAMQNCDVLLAVGARFDDRVIGNPKHFAQNERKIIHIDVDPSSISKRVRVDIPIVGDVKDVLTELIAMVRESDIKPDSGALAGWWEQIETWRKRDCLKYDHRRWRRHQAPVRHRDAVEHDRRMWKPTSPPTSASTRCGPRSTTASTSRAAGSTPAAWAPWAWAFRTPWASSSPSPKPKLFCITGEGLGADVHPGTLHLPAVQDADQDLLAEQPLPGHGAAVAAGGVRRAATAAATWTRCPDFVKLAEAYGHVGMLIERPQDVEPALREARKLKDRTVFMDFRTDPTENVVPDGPGRQGHHRDAAGIRRPLNRR